MGLHVPCFDRPPFSLTLSRWVFGSLIGWLPQAVLGGVGNGLWIKEGSRNVVLGAAQSTHHFGRIWTNSLGPGIFAEEGPGELVCQS